MFRRRPYRRPPWGMNALTDGILWFGVLSIALACGAFLADCQNRYF